MAYSSNSFTLMEKVDTREAFSRWQGEINEKVDEYTLRKRKDELYALVRKVIKNELSPAEQKLIQLHWYEGKSLTEVAKLMGLDKSTVSRKEKKINNIIYDKLKYAMEYRYGKSFSENARLIIKSRSPACCPCDGKSISQRLHNLRLRQSLSLNDVACVSGITEKRISHLEKEGNSATADELSRLAKLFGTTSDYIIFGKDVSQKGEI